MTLALFLLDFKKGKLSAVSIFVTLEYLAKSFKQNLAAALFNFINVHGGMGSLTVEAYSTIGRTMLL